MATASGRHHKPIRCGWVTQIPINRKELTVATNTHLLEQLRGVGMHIAMLTPTVQAARDAQEISPDVVAAFGNVLTAINRLQRACKDQLKPGWANQQPDADSGVPFNTLPTPEEQGYDRGPVTDL